ncbi:MAG TPA: glucuronate isomerase [Candidatus Eisenbacteria bacterium]|nr:glucuronate isomerase [Candidatus Eisenbacteria bacterium]
MQASSASPASNAGETPRGHALAKDSIQLAVNDVLASTQFIDIHTHLFSPAFGKLGLWGIDELLTYHYLEAELFRSTDLKPAEYWELSKTQKADIIWRRLFLDNTPISEATRGVVAVLNAFGLPTDAADLSEARAFFQSQSIETQISTVFQLAGINSVVMTNDPLDPEEVSVWRRGGQAHAQFHGVMRLDRIVRHWPAHWQRLVQEGYAVDLALTGKSIPELRRFLADWAARMKPLYMAVSLEDSFLYPDDTTRTKILSEGVLPSCREFNIPMSLMIGVRPQVNPALRLAGDAVGRADLRALENLCREFPDNRFLVSVLSRENQHELCVYARKFNNLMPFGCWWFLNNPSIVEEITRERIEMLGTSFIPQHSDARVLEQVIYKWKNTRVALRRILGDFYHQLAGDGWPVSAEEIRRDVTRMFRRNFEQFVGKTLG